MGHVDHGKTTLLDSIRSIRHKIVNTEVGGITQSIGAYTVRIDGKKIVFIDTPGHEAFTAMRARGAQATDVAILVVAADDGIMPQTAEAISHAKAAKVPIIVAVNKIDKADADPDRVLQQLTEYNLVPEKWGGDTVCVEVSALQGTNIDELLEMILLVSEMENLKADHAKNGTGVIIEAKLDKGKGAVATLLVQEGVLKVGDYVVAGNVAGKVRALLSDEGERINEAGPSTPVEILGLTEVPQSGDRFEVVRSDKEMKTIISQRKEEERTTRLEAIAPTQIRKEMILQTQQETKDLNIIIKANTHGSAEAVSAAAQQLVSKQIFVKIVHIGIGDISEADVMLADASNAIIIGFAVKEDANALRIATNVGVDIRKYDIIYQVLDDIEKTMLGLLQPEFKEVETGTAEVRQVFSIGKTAKIAGCYVLDGKIIRNKTAKVIRDGKEIHKGVIDQLKRFKDDVKEVASGYECGISFSKFNDIQEGDLIKVSIIEEIEREVLV
ncbi:MAG TPA: translation initiation factor IF-2 [Cyanobacteria bacterium UBA9579]|nr:translation initiation factor IF-2 [Cyanobacteria bacterium UBA9579]